MWVPYNEQSQLFELFLWWGEEGKFIKDTYFTP